MATHGIETAGPASAASRGRRVAILLLVLLPIVLIAGGFAVHGAFNMCEGRRLRATGSWSSRLSWMPPGVECTYGEDGQMRTDLIPWTKG